MRTPRFFWPEQLGGRRCRLLGWERLEEEQVGCGKNMLSSVLDVLNLRCQVDLPPSGNVKEAVRYLSLGSRHEVRDRKCDT